MSEPARVAIRPLTEPEVPTAVDLLAAVAAEGRWLGSEAPIDRAARAEQLRADLAAPSGVARLVATVDGEIVGHLGLDLASTGVANLGMFVASGSRRRGVGTALVRAAIEEARRWGAHKVALQLWPHNQAARAFVSQVWLRRGGTPAPSLPPPGRVVVGRAGDGPRPRRGLAGKPPPGLRGAQAGRRAWRLGSRVATTSTWRRASCSS